MNPEKRLNMLFDPFDRQDTPGCTILVRHGGRTVYEKAFGMASIEYNVKNRMDTRFLAASVTKQFTAMCITLIEEDGRLSVSDSIYDYLPRLPWYGTDITIDQLLHHVSGLRETWNMFTLRGHSMEDLCTRQQALSLIYNQRETNFLPGYQFLYSNNGYTLLAEIVHTVSRKSIREFAKERIFDPLGMTSTFFCDDHREMIPHMGTPYRLAPDGKEFIRFFCNLDVVGSTGLVTTTCDMAKWLDNIKSPRICTKKTMVRMTDFPKESISPDKSIENYGRGLMLQCYKGRRMIFHGGAIAGWRAIGLWLPELDVDAVLLSNYMYFYPLLKAYAMLDILFSSELANEEAPYFEDTGSHFERLVNGLYHDDFDACIIQKCEKSILWRQGDMTWRFDHKRGNEYACNATSQRLWLLRDDTVDVEAEVAPIVYTLYVENGRIGQSKAGAYITPNITLRYSRAFETDGYPGPDGTYYSPELGAIYGFRRQKGTIIMNNIASGKHVFFSGLRYGVALCQ